MSREGDDELERIKRQKLEEMLVRRKEAKSPSRSPDGPVDLTDGTFKNFIEENSMAVVDFWAPWCGPCLFVSPIVEEMARDYAGRIAFGKLNVDQNPKTASQYRVMSIPTLLVFKKGRLVDQIVGAMPKQRLESRIASHLN